jgi:hypothetical protein
MLFSDPYEDYQTGRRWCGRWFDFLLHADHEPLSTSTVHGGLSGRIFTRLFGGVCVVGARRRESAAVEMLAKSIGKATTVQSSSSAKDKLRESSWAVTGSQERDPRA